MNIGEINGVQVAVSPKAYEEIKKQKIIEENKILKEQQQELERYKNIIEEVLESVCCIEHNLDKYEEIGLDHLEYAQNKIAELKEYLIELKGSDN